MVVLWVWRKLYLSIHWWIHRCGFTTKVGCTVCSSEDTLKVGVVITAKVAWWSCSLLSSEFLMQAFFKVCRGLVDNDTPLWSVRSNLLQLFLILHQWKLVWIKSLCCSLVNFDVFFYIKTLHTTGARGCNFAPC